MIKKPRLRLEFKITLSVFMTPNIYYFIIKYVNKYLYFDAIYYIENGFAKCLKEIRKNNKGLPKNISKNILL